MWLPDRKGFSLRAEAVYYFGEKGMNTFFLWKTIFCIVNCACGMLLHFKNILGVYLQNLCFCNTVSHVNSLFVCFLNNIGFLYILRIGLEVSSLIYISFKKLR